MACLKITNHRILNYDPVKTIHSITFDFNDRYDIVGVEEHLGFALKNARFS